ncbi:Gpi ethanolamine phosphate transferase [Thalictrum thalictroides]|uniref:GPI ethanolamine phosphate transferase 1 n=1 Tax=Thalictrum thalictroides TaxID=46969 RepID=A0A7J6X9J8_THATH|nr:Gpi ethanolamine phosphate transferase [Thalictrum thalictroides]
MSLNFFSFFLEGTHHQCILVKHRVLQAETKRMNLTVCSAIASRHMKSSSSLTWIAPTKRLVLLIKVRWGVSHARPPTESRPGHVAIIAGFYEDPSAVTKACKVDDLMSLSSHSIHIGPCKSSPVTYQCLYCQLFYRFFVVVCPGVPIRYSIIISQSPNNVSGSVVCVDTNFMSIFNADASFLDEWSFDQFQSLLNSSNDDPKLKQVLLQDNLVIFLHLLGCDSNGHAHRPYSSIYLNNVRVVDRIAEGVYNLVEGFFKDNQTAYVFTADHGMSDKGSHGDGHPANTDTPLVAWGAGVKYPKRVFHTSHPDDGFRFVDEHMHDVPTPRDWGLSTTERVDVNQADIAPLMSALLGLPCPVNSVGNLPLGYINLSEAEEVEAVVANTKQILSQFLRKSQLKQANSLRFKPYKPLEKYYSYLEKIEDLLSSKDYKAAMEMSYTLRRLSLEGLHYFQTYDWFMLMTVVTLGYIGWMVYLALHVLQSYTAFPGNVYRKANQVYICGFMLMGVISVLMFLERSPPLYHVYTSMTVFLWTQIFSEYQFLKAMWKTLSGSKVDVIVKLLATCVVSVFILEFLVYSFTERKLYTLYFLIVGVVASIYLLTSVRGRSSAPIFVWVSCWFLSVFTLMPAEIPDNTLLVFASGAIIILIGVGARCFESSIQGHKNWLGMLKYDKQKPSSPMLFYVQILLVGLSSGMVWLSTSHRTENQELLILHQLVNWLIAGFSMVLPLFSPTGPVSRLTSIFLGFAPPFLLLSIGYEAVFYSALALVLMAWILFECAVYSFRQAQIDSTFMKNVKGKIILGHDERCLQLSDMRVPLIFMVLFNVAFFGTGNFASIASFEISSVYRFITVFSPFLMAALLIFKLFIPFMLVICAFSAVTKLIRVSRLGCYFLVILCSDVMTIHFFFLVRNTGSWMEIGNSISHFGIVSAQVVFVLLLFALTNIYTQNIQIESRPSSSLKAM